MKLRLRSAIALVGWHLISPIRDPAKPGVLPAKTPLSQWRNLGTFDSSDQCQKALTALRASFEQDTRREITAWRKQNDNSQVQRVLHAAAAQAVAERSLCITSDDPRLKKTRSEGHLSSPPQKGIQPASRHLLRFGIQKVRTRSLHRRVVAMPLTFVGSRQRPTTRRRPMPRLLHHFQPRWLPSHRRLEKLRRRSIRNRGPRRRRFKTRSSTSRS